MSVSDQNRSRRTAVVWSGDPDERKIYPSRIDRATFDAFDAVAKKRGMSNGALCALMIARVGEHPELLEASSSRHYDEMIVRAALRRYAESHKGTTAVGFDVGVMGSEIEDMIAGRETLSDRVCKLLGFQRVTRYIEEVR